MTDALLTAFHTTRRESLDACAGLALEDYSLQAAEFASPPKWHLAHTTWFFETFLLQPFAADYRSPDPAYAMLFNSYYNGVGEQFTRAQRGLLSRPSLEAVLAWRGQVNAAVAALVEAGHPEAATIRERLRLGIEHERQHQELLFTDIKYSLAVNPLLPALSDAPVDSTGDTPPLRWERFEGGLLEIGHDGEGFCFDNEQPRHRSYLQPFTLADRLVSNGEFAEFVADGGYERPELWLADGWATVQRENWRCPLYWREREGQPLEYTLYGLKERSAAAPVCHLSGYEADAYARWAGARLPTEQEWEVAALQAPTPRDAPLGERLHPAPAGAGTGLRQLYDACWQWTRSAYSPYPGYRPCSGAIGEYNGKFMSNQWVLRGGSCVSKAAQLRPSYRNFFYPPDRWQFSGLRLAKDTN